MFNKIPFHKTLYLKTLPAVLGGVIFIFVIAMVFFDYELTTADPFGAAVSSVLLAYIIHLALWKPGEE